MWQIENTKDNRWTKRHGSSTSDLQSPTTTSPPLPHPPNHLFLMTATLKDLTLKAACHWVVNLILRIVPCGAQISSPWEEKDQKHDQAEGLLVCLFVGCLPSNMQVYLRDGSAKTIVRAATLRQKLQIKLSISPSHSILTLGRPVPMLTL